jgi:hypothetical protein
MIQYRPHFADIVVISPGRIIGGVAKPVAFDRNEPQVQLAPQGVDKSGHQKRPRARAGPAQKQHRTPAGLAGVGKMDGPPAGPGQRLNLRSQIVETGLECGRRHRDAGGLHDRCALTRKGGRHGLCQHCGCEHGV